LAVQGSSIVNGNLFVLAWLCFFMSWAILKLVLEQAYCMDQARNGNLAYLTPTRDGYPPLIALTHYRLGHMGLFLSSLVVLVSSAREYQQQLCSDWDRQLCKRLLFSTSVAVMTLIGLLVTWGAFFWHQKYRSNVHPIGIIPSTRIRLGLTGLLAIGWFLATAMGTFGKHGPGHALGNYFFGVWISLGLSLYLLKKTLLEHVSAQQQPKLKREKEPEQPKRTPEQPKRIATATATATTTSSNKRRSQKNRIPGLIQDEENDYRNDEKQEEEPPMSTSCTEDMESISIAATPSMISTKAYLKTPTLVASHGKKSASTHETIAISLDASFRNEDPEQGLRIIRKTSTDKTEEEDFDYEDDVSSDKTPKRGSASRSVSNAPRTSQSAMTSASRASEKSDFYHERIKPTSIPFATGDFDDVDELEESYDRNGLSSSTITTAIDNTSAAQRDVLIDPKDFVLH